MKRFKASLLAAALGLVLGTGTSAHASVGWGVDWSPPPGPSGTPVNPYGIVMGSDATGPTIITFSNPTFQSFSTLSSQTTASNLTLSTNSSSTSPLIVSQINGQVFQVDAKVYDGTTTSAPSQTVVFTGKLWGSFSTGGVTTYSSWLSPTTQTITFTGTGDKFTVSIVGLQGPPIPGLSSHPGQILAQITEVPGSGGGTTTHGTPEPSTMLMGCMGLSFLGLASWRKRARGPLAA